MTTNIIDAATVAALAFQGCSYVPKELITPELIEKVEMRYIIPVIGQKLADRVSSGDYPELFERLAMPIALYVKQYLDHPNSPASSMNLATARAYMKGVSDMLDRNKHNYKEYDPSHNILKKCMIDGGIVL
ncbi:MAG: hypothetical protein SNH13_00445 [Rikenellaceae bacterium]